MYRFSHREWPPRKHPSPEQRNLLVSYMLIFVNYDFTACRRSLVSSINHPNWFSGCFIGNQKSCAGNKYCEIFCFVPSRSCKLWENEQSWKSEPEKRFIDFHVSENKQKKEGSEGTF